jgi:hypothetical protein
MARLSYAKKHAIEQRKLGMFKAIRHESSGHRLEALPGKGGGYGGGVCKRDAVGNYIISDNCFRTDQFHFDMDTCEATSYAWWTFVLRVGNTIYFNDASYSMQTRQHQTMAWNIIQAECPERHGIKVKTVDIRAGLNHLSREIDNCQTAIKELQEKIASPRSRKDANKKRLAYIAELKAEIEELKRLKPIFDKQIELNKEIKAQAVRVRLSEKHKQELVRVMRKKSEKRIVLKPTSYVAITTVPDNGMGFYFVYSVYDFSKLNIAERFSDDITGLIPVEGNSLEESKQNLETKCNADYVTERMLGNVDAVKYEVA